MKTLKPILLACMMICIFASLTCGQKESVPTGSTHEDLVQFFTEWRDFQKPNVENGVPDYSADAMAAQKARIPHYKARLAAIDTTGWSVPEQVDYEIVKVEIKGLQFDHRVMRPWAKNPLFYAVIQMYESDVPAREGPEIYGVLNVFKHNFPLDDASQKIFKDKLSVIPAILKQAKLNLVEDAGDFYFFGVRDKLREGVQLANLAKQFETDNMPELKALALTAKEAVDDFASWLEERQIGMPDFSGIGIEEFDKYMKHVHLVPYSWQQQVDLIKRELERSLAALAMEEHRNRHLKQLEPARSLGQMKRRMKKSVAAFMDFIRDDDIFTVPDYMHLDDEVTSFTPEERLDFFSHINYREPIPLQCHQIHWLEKQRELLNTHPIRGVPLLYNIWDSRAEGLATGFEELMMQAGILEDRPRARELTHIMLAFRAIRALGGLMLHAGKWTLQEAVDFAVETTPRGFVKPSSNTIWGDYALYLAQPGYGTSYVYGKLQLDRLIADRAGQLGDRFVLKEFFDDYFARGIIPASLLRWEMTGLDDEIKELRK